MMKKTYTLTLLFFLISSLPVLSQKKNVILITVDDLNDWVGAFGGHPQAQTPNIDALAAKGVAFQNASCSSPVCNPSKTALMTGRRAHETGYDNNNGANNAKHFRDNPNAWIKNLTTMPQYFGQQGYKTVSKGKLFHKPDESKGEFQTVGPKSQGASKGSDSQTIGNTGGKLEWSRSNQSLKQTGDYASAQYGANFLSQNHNKPFFLGVGIFRPHIPLHAPKEFYNKVPAIDDIILPPLFKANDRNDTYGSSNNYRQAIINDGGPRRWKEWTRAYLANIAFADACVGHLLDALENSQYANNTIVVLVGDHGWHMGEKDHVLKFTLWDRAVKTPMIIFDPSRGSGDCNKAVSLQDIFPTLVDLSGVDDPSFTVRGRSLKKLVNNPGAEWCGAALTSYSGSHSIRSDRYRYIKYKNGKEELYDHQEDPGEWVNLANKASHSAVKQQMKTALNKMLNFNENPFGNGCPGDGVNCMTQDSDNDGTNNCNDLCPNDPKKTEPGDCGCGEVETANCGVGVLPSNITDLATSVESCNVILSWTDSEGEEAYRIRRKKLGEATFTNIADIPSERVEFEDHTVEENTTYVYTVRPLVDGAAAAVSNKPRAKVGTCIITARRRSVKKKSFSLFPNPTTGMVSFSKKVQWELRLLTGEFLASGFGDRLDFSTYPGGVYFVKIDNGQVVKVIKE